MVRNILNLHHHLREMPSKLPQLGWLMHPPQPPFMKSSPYPSCTIQFNRLGIASNCRSYVNIWITVQLSLVQCHPPTQRSRSVRISSMISATLMKMIGPSTDHHLSMWMNQKWVLFPLKVKRPWFPELLHSLSGLMKTRLKGTTREGRHCTVKGVFRCKFYVLTPEVKWNLSAQTNSLNNALSNIMCGSLCSCLNLQLNKRTNCILIHMAM